jgi:hypothetical protein
MPAAESGEWRKAAESGGKRRRVAEGGGEWRRMAETSTAGSGTEIGWSVLDGKEPLP